MTRKPIIVIRNDSCKRHDRPGPILILLIFLAALTGCSKSGRVVTYPVEGVVTLDGKPVEGATVNFMPVETENPDKEPAGGITDSAGSYKLSSFRGLPEKGAVDGEYVVTVSRTELIVNPDGRKRPPDHDDYWANKEWFPVKYTEPETSPLRFTVTKGKNTFNIDVQSK